jgi:hypothetical protein
MSLPIIANLWHKEMFLAIELDAYDFWRMYSMDVTTAECLNRNKTFTVRQNIGGSIHERSKMVL